jgi:hypothetical protein
MTSAILTKLAETYPEILTNPESVLGPNSPKVLEFWRHIDGLSEPEREKMNDRYLALDEDVRDCAWIAAKNAATEVIGAEFNFEALYAAQYVTGKGVFGYATYEIIGGVEDPIFYNLIMSHKNL